MNDDIAAGPAGTRPEGNPDLGVPGDSPLAGAPEPEAPALEPGPTEPAVDAAEWGDDAPEPGPDDAPAEPRQRNTDLIIDTIPDDVTPVEALARPLPEAGEAVAPAREPRRLSRGEREVYDRTRQRFAACGRCGYLMADFLIMLGEETLQEAAIRSRDGWLRLEGDETLGELLVKAFGVRLDLGYDFMDGSCPECRRRFVFAALEDGRVRLKLRT